MNIQIRNITFLSQSCGQVTCAPLLPRARELLPYDEVSTSSDPSVVSTPGGPRSKAKNPGSIWPG